MKITIWVASHDNEDGTGAIAFKTEHEAQDEVLMWCGTDRAEWKVSDHADDFFEYIQAKSDDLDTYNLTSQELEFGTDEMWFALKETPGSFGNLYDPNELTSMDMIEGYDGDNPAHYAAVLKWCEIEGPDFEDQVSELVWSNVPGTMDDLMAAIKEEDPA